VASLKASLESTFTQRPAVLYGGEESCGPPGAGLAVVVEQEDDRRTGVARAAVARGGGAGWSRANDTGATALGDDEVDDLGFARAVVDDDDLESAAFLLFLERREATGEGARPVASGNDDGETKIICHHQLSLSDYLHELRRGPTINGPPPRSETTCDGRLGSPPHGCTPCLLFGENWNHEGGGHAAGRRLARGERRAGGTAQR
jgi:hypothetical protein